MEFKMEFLNKFWLMLMNFLLVYNENKDEQAFHPDINFVFEHEEHSEIVIYIFLDS